MSDIVERLRELCDDWDGSEIPGPAEPRIVPHCRLLREAAATIERLTKELEVQRVSKEYAQRCCTKAEAELAKANERTAAAVATIERLTKERDHYLSNWKDARRYLAIETGHAEDAEARADSLAAELAKAREALQ